MTLDVQLKPVFDLRSGTFDNRGINDSFDEIRSVSVCMAFNARVRTSCHAIGMSEYTQGFENGLRVGGLELLRVKR